MSKIGERVGAIESANQNEVRLFGYGVYTGDKIPPKSVGGMNFSIPNPCILLDSGTEIYGCECWWGGEDEIRSMIGNRTVVIVKPERFKEESDE